MCSSLIFCSLSRLTPRILTSEAIKTICDLTRSLPHVGAHCSQDYVEQRLKNSDVQGQGEKNNHQPIDTLRLAGVEDNVTVK